MSAHAEDNVDLEVLVNLEQQFYDVGYEDGMEHGKIHGRIEGRELGREKGFEMWEELGFYEGFAKLWFAVSERGEGKDSRVSHNAKLLLELIAQFPMENPSHTEVDVTKLFGQIRSRYKMLCAFVGTKPSLRASQAQSTPSQSQSILSTATTVADTGLALPKKGTVWDLNAANNPGGVDYSF